MNTKNYSFNMLKKKLSLNKNQHTNRFPHNRMSAIINKRNRVASYQTGKRLNRTIFH